MKNAYLENFRSLAILYFITFSRQYDFTIFGIKERNFAISFFCPFWVRFQNQVPQFILHRPIIRLERKQNTVLIIQNFRGNQQHELLYCVSEFLINPTLLRESGPRKKIEFSITCCSFFLILSLSSFIESYGSLIWYKKCSDVYFL